MNAASWRTPLLVLLAATAVSALCIGLRNTFGLYLRPMTEAHGWGREIFALAIAIQNLVWGLSAPFTGALADRYGTGRVIACGSVTYALGLYLMAQSTSLLGLTFAMGILIGLGTSATGFGVIVGAVSRVASESRRSLYLGIATAGGSMGQFVLVSFSQGSIFLLGWVDSLMILAAISLLMAPLAAVLAGKAERPSSAAGAAASPLHAFREAGRESRYWLLFWGFFVCGFHIAFIATHLPAFLTDNRVSPGVAALALGLIGFFNIFGTLGFGYLGGRFSKRKTLSALYLARSVLIALFIALPLSGYTVLAFAAVMGFLWLGTVPLTAALVGQMYGVRYLNTLFSVVFLGHQLGSFLGVWLGGRVYDLTGSYDQVWLAAIALGVFAAAVHWPIDERPSEEIRAARLAARPAAG
ncbi:MAG: MFS transporter [SAR324 cluster bacterium]|nr:MFS transporter [SAR324 cluster bacterium]